MHTHRAVLIASSFVGIFERRSTRHHYAHQKIVFTQTGQATTTAAGCFTERQQRQPHG